MRPPPKEAEYVRRAVQSLQLGVVASMRPPPKEAEYVWARRRSARLITLQ